MLLTKRVEFGGTVMMMVKKEAWAENGKTFQPFLDAKSHSLIRGERYYDTITYTLIDQIVLARTNSR